MVVGRRVTLFSEQEQARSKTALLLLNTGGGRARCANQGAHPPLCTQQLSSCKRVNYCNSWVLQRLQGVVRSPRPRNTHPAALRIAHCVPVLATNYMLLD
jgi:hypothetical protein